MIFTCALGTTLSNRRYSTCFFDATFSLFGHNFPARLYADLSSHSAGIGFRWALFVGVLGYAPYAAGLYTNKVRFLF